MKCRCGQNSWRTVRATDKAVVDVCKKCGRERTRRKKSGEYAKALRKRRRRTAHKSRVRNAGA